LRRLKVELPEALKGRNAVRSLGDPEVHLIVLRPSGTLGDHAIWSNGAVFRGPEPRKAALVNRWEAVGNPYGFLTDLNAPPVLNAVNLQKKVSLLDFHCIKAWAFNGRHRPIFTPVERNKHVILLVTVLQQCAFAVYRRIGSIARTSAV
jgi:hypothetical protein